jgi:hypothetical protein
MARVQRNDRYYRVTIHPTPGTHDVEWSILECRYVNGVPHSRMLGRGHVETSEFLQTESGVWDLLSDLARDSLLR